MKCFDVLRDITAKQLLGLPAAFMDNTQACT